MRAGALSKLNYKFLSELFIGNSGVLSHKVTYHSLLTLLNSQESFDNIDIWLKELKTHSNPDAKVFLIGNKIDLEEDRKIKKEQGENYTNEFNLNMFMESSAKTGFNAQKIFIEAAKLLYEDYIKFNDKESSRTSSISGLKQMISVNEKNLNAEINIKQSKCAC